jgi:hypothetical protein
MNRFLTFIIFILFVSCTDKKSGDNTSHALLLSESTEYPKNIRDVWSAHGGLETWNNYQSLEFTLLSGSDSPSERHMINLKDRRVRIESDSFMIGMDGEKIWVHPSAEATETDPRFYHNLMFYFFSIPFVMSDPGVNIEDAGMTRLNETSYLTLNIYFDEGTGDADDDQYVLLINPDTKQLEWLLYTVTYFSGEPAQRYNALEYTDLQEVDGLFVPANLTGYTYANDTTGNPRYRVSFTDIRFSENSFDESVFSKPTQAVFVDKP